MIYRPHIDGLRAISVLGVVFFHFHSNLVPGGFVGVDVFFVISGYLISLNIFKDLSLGQFSFLDFYFRRIRRIFPALILVLVSCLAFGWFFLLGKTFALVGQHAGFGSLFASNYLLLTENGYFTPSAELKPFLHLWSLSIEEQFYVFWPLLLFIFWRFRLNTLSCLLFCIVASFLFNVGSIERSPDAAFYLLHNRVWELMSGALLAYFQTFKEHELSIFFQRLFFRSPEKEANIFPKVANLQSWLGLGLIFLSFVIIDKERAFPGWWALLPVIGTCFALSADSNSFANNYLLSLKPFVWIGLISYPLYLWHWPLLTFTKILEIDPTYKEKIEALVLSFALAILTYALVERPIRKSRFSRAYVSLFLTSTLATTGILGFLVYSNDGYKQRLPELLQRIDDPQQGWRAGTCFLELFQNEKAFNSNDCVEKNTPLDRSSKKIALWGDSHAAHFFPAIDKLRKQYNFRLAQFTAAACPPLVGLDFPERPVCKSINSYFFRELRKFSPDIVWISSGALLDYDLDELDLTISELRKFGVQKIVFFGPTPVWKKPLARLMFKKYLSNKNHEMPEFLSTGLSENSAPMDLIFQDKAKKLGLIYISPFQILCPKEGCLTNVGKKAGDLVQIDNAHLTYKGSEYLFSQIPKVKRDEIFGN